MRASRPSSRRRRRRAPSSPRSGQRDVAPGGQVRKELQPARPDLAIVLHAPWPDTGTEAELQWLASPEGRRGSMYRVTARVRFPAVRFVCSAHD